MSDCHPKIFFYYYYYSVTKRLIFSFSDLDIRNCSPKDPKFAQIGAKKVPQFWMEKIKEVSFLISRPKGTPIVEEMMDTIRQR